VQAHVLRPHSLAASCTGERTNTFLVDSSGVNKEAFLVKAEPINPSEKKCSAKPNYSSC
jgi:hypothetical protein